MYDFLPRRIAGARFSWRPDLTWGVGAGAAGLVIRWAIAPVLGLGAPFILFVPGVLLASIFGGWRAGLICLGISGAGAMAFLANAPIFLTPRVWLGEATFLFVGGVTVWLAGAMRHAVTELQARERQQRLLVAELQHRVKNTLAIVQAIAQQTISSAADPAQIKADLTDRLVALGLAHNLLVDSAGESVDLAALAGNALKPFAEGHAGRVTIDGPPVQIPADLAVSVALCLHELATNALKYGSLSGPAGAVALNWSLDARAQPPRLALAWRETGGPRVVAPTRSGFGSRLLQRGLGGRANPAVKLDFADTGVTWTASFDVSPPAEGFYAPRALIAGAAAGATPDPRRLSQGR